MSLNTGAALENLEFPNNRFENINISPRYGGGANNNSQGNNSAKQRSHASTQQVTNKMRGKQFFANNNVTANFPSQMDDRKSAGAIIT